MGSVQRKKSGKIFAGSDLIITGQGIYSVKVIKPTFNKKSQYNMTEQITTTTTTTK